MILRVIANVAWRLSLYASARRYLSGRTIQSACGVDAATRQAPDVTELLRANLRAELERGGVRDVEAALAELDGITEHYVARLRNPTTSPPQTEPTMSERAFAPHCDTSVLHAPGTCEHCDLYPDWQHYRQVARISFTGDDPGELAPCPSEWFRPAVSRDAWPGNRPRL